MPKNYCEHQARCKDGYGSGCTVAHCRSETLDAPKITRFDEDLYIVGLIDGKGLFNIVASNRSHCIVGLHTGLLF